MAEMIFHPEARAELRAAAAYYESCRTGLGREFWTHVEAAAALVLSNPHAGGVIRAPYRRLIMRRFPYGVIYRHTGDVIYVVAIMHLKRRPGYWRWRTQSP